MVICSPLRLCFIQALTVPCEPCPVLFIQEVEVDDDDSDVSSDDDLPELEDGGVHCCPRETHPAKPA